jgi:protein Tex
MRHLSGLNQLLAQEIVEHRKKNGPYKNRAQLLEVPGLTPEKFELCAGFLQVHNGDEPFDATNFHPEDYEMAKKILDAFGIAKDEWKTPEKKQELLQKAIDANLKDIIATTGIDSVTSLKDFLDELINPLSQEQIKRFGPVYRVRQLDFEELQLGQELPGVVQNVVEFGCFVDVGIKESGLVHISQISARYVRSPYESVSVGDIVTVWVIALDKEKSRLSLTMINPNREPDHQGSGRSSRAPARDYPRRPDRRPDAASQNAEGNQGGDSQGAPLRPRSPERPAGRFPAARSNSGGSSSGGGSAGSSRSSSSFRPRDDKPRGARPPRLDPNRPPQIRTFSSQKPIEKPNLSQSALSGDSPLGTFAELAVFWEKSTPNDAGETKKGAETQNQANQSAPQKDQEGTGSPE